VSRFVGAHVPQTELARAWAENNVFGTVQRSQLARNLLRTVGRVVVNNYNLVAEVVLLKSTAQQVHDERQVLTFIVCRQNHTASEGNNLTYLYLCCDAPAATASRGMSITEVAISRGFTTAARCRKRGQMLTNREPCPLFYQLAHGAWR